MVILRATFHPRDLMSPDSEWLGTSQISPSNDGYIPSILRRPFAVAENHDISLKTSVLRLAGTLWTCFTGAFLRSGGIASKKRRWHWGAR